MYAGGTRGLYVSGRLELVVLPLLTDPMQQDLLQVGSESSPEPVTNRALLFGNPVREPFLPLQHPGAHIFT